MRTKIISAFPGVGKTHFYNMRKGSTSFHRNMVLDSDSSLFWVEQDGVKIRNPDFPNNYIKHILDNIGKYDYILVSSHKEVREALLNSCLFFTLIFPRRSQKEEYLARYKQRGSPENFIKLANDNWDNWIDDCLSCNYGCLSLVCGHNYLADIIWNNFES